MEICFTIDKKSPETLWRQTKNQISNYISEQKLAPGTRLPNVKDLANQAGISLKTSERALLELVKEGVCFRRPKQGTFVGKAVKEVEASKICGILHHDGLQSFEGDLVQHLIYQGIRSGNDNSSDTFFLSGDPGKSIERYLNLSGLELQGILMLHWLDLDEAVKLALKFPDLRFIFINYVLDDFENTPDNMFGIFNDDFGGGFQLGEHMIGLGHKRFGAVSLELQNQNYNRRIAGFKTSLNSHKLSLADSQIITAPQKKGINTFDDLREIGFQSAEKLLSRDKSISAIFATNDHLAEGVLAAIRQNNLTDKVSVTGYDAFSIFNKKINFTTVAIDLEKMGYMAIKLLLDKNMPASKIFNVSPQLLIKGEV